MTQDFLEAHAETIEAEGIYDNDYKDSGGETALGLTIKDDSSWKGWPIVHAVTANIPRPSKESIEANYSVYKDYIHRVTAALQPFKAQLIELSKEPYYEKYWASLRLDDLQSASMKKNFFRISVNQGQPTALTNMYNTVNLPRQNHVTDELITALAPSL